MNDSHRRSTRNFSRQCSPEAMHAVEVRGAPGRLNAEAWSHKVLWTETGFVPDLRVNREVKPKERGANPPTVGTRTGSEAGCGRQAGWEQQSPKVIRDAPGRAGRRGGKDSAPDLGRSPPRERGGSQQRRGRHRNAPAPYSTLLLAADDPQVGLQGKRDVPNPGGSEPESDSALIVR